MIFLIKRAFAAFGKKYNYDVDYMLEMAEIYPAKAWQFALIAPLFEHFSAVPVDVYYAVKIYAAKLAGCGPCLELTLNMAQQASIEKQQIAYLILDDVAKMSPQILLGYKYALAVDQNDADLLELIDEVKIEYGKKGLWDLANAFTFGQYYPKLKRGIGEAVSCRRPQDMLKELLDE